MLSQMIKQHQETMRGRIETQEKLKKEAVESANELTANLVRIHHWKNLMSICNLVVKICKSIHSYPHRSIMIIQLDSRKINSSPIIKLPNQTDHLNVGVATAYLNQKRLDLESKNLNTNANNFNKQRYLWMHN